MAKTYTVAFGSGDPRTFTGLSPTLLIFVNASSGATLVAPTFSEALTGSGIYKFAYGTTTPIAFLADAATTSPGSVGRYVVGQIDPNDRMDEVGSSLVALGTTTVALGTTTVALGTTTAALGTTAVAIGTSQIAQGVSILAFGVTLNAIGTTTVGLGTTTVALGITSVAYLTTNSTNIGTIINQGTTLTALGTTSVALGISTIAGQGILGTSLIAIGVTQLAQGILITQTDTDVLALGTSFGAFGTSSIALGNTILASTGSGGSLGVVIGTTASPIGDNVTDPATIFGYLKRFNEAFLGQEQFIKSSGAFTFYDRSGATTLATRTITNSATMVTRT